MKKPTRGAVVCGSIPFAALCFSVPLWDRVDPMLFGIPFNLFWLLTWMALTPLCLWAAYRFETRNPKRDESQ